MFAQAAVDPVLGTVVWPNGADLDPDVLANAAVPSIMCDDRLLMADRPMRAHKRGVGEKGSRFRLQQYLHAHPDRFELLLRDASSTLDRCADEPLSWRSPRAEADYEQFRDELWADLGLPSAQATGWWPRNGPQWDAVAETHARDGRRGIILVESKGRLGEDEGSANRTNQATLAQRQRALEDTRTHLGAGPTDWTRGYYQMANRIAHLDHLRRTLRQEAWLVFCYFTGDAFLIGGKPADCPADEAGWQHSIDRAWQRLGLERGRHPLAAWVVEVYPPVLERPTPPELAEAVPSARRSAVTRRLLATQ